MTVCMRSSENNTHHDKQEVNIGKADERTLEAFYQAHYDRIFDYVYRSVRHHEEAEDLTSQIFLKVVSGLDETRAAKVTTIWLFQLTRTTLGDYWRARARASLCSTRSIAGHRLGSAHI